ncbi:MAG: hypothetical protein AB1782_02880 [Cyanobacteriota bacterium]
MTLLERKYYLLTGLLILSIVNIQETLGDVAPIDPPAQSVNNFFSTPVIVILGAIIITGLILLFFVSKLIKNKKLPSKEEVKNG